SDLLDDRDEEAVQLLSVVKGVRVVKPQGAFYLTVIFDEGVLNNQQKLPVENEKIHILLSENIRGVSLDKRFVYYLLAATGICVVPLTGFASNRDGFRMTLLETDDVKRRETSRTVAACLATYLDS